ncbi:MAG: DUF7507 domain-containing protein, partial [Acidimicrobiia bacterium]
MKRLMLVASMAISMLVVSVAGAAANGIFVIPIDTVINEPPGTLTVLAVVDTPPELVGASCEALAVAQNQESVHPNNDLIIETGGTSAVLHDVEGSENKTTVASGPVTLGPTVTITLLMGNHGWFSGGFAVVMDTECTPPPEPAIQITKTADPTTYVNNTGEFTISVHNPGPVDLHDVYVTDDYATNIDPTSVCPTTIGDLAIGETYTYECEIKGLDGVSPYTNPATAIGTGPLGKQVTDTDEATVVPEVQNTTLTTVPPTTTPPTTEAPGTTQAPGTTSAPGETLPVTGLSGDQAQG